jgi:hypothetical protein
MKYVALAAVLLLSGCSLFEPRIVPAPFPTPPSNLMVPPPALKTVAQPEEGKQVSLDDFLKTIGKNYEQYRLTANQLISLQEWLAKQEAESKK